MNPNIKDIREITDSKELYGSKPNPFIAIFIHILLVGIIASIVWLYFGEIDLVSKGKGIVRPNENISTLKSKVTGEISHNVLQEGKKVKRGDVLLELEHEDLDIKREQTKALLQTTTDILKKNTLLKDSIEKEKNLFNPTKDKEYCNRYIKYEQDYKALQNDTTISQATEEISTSQMTINQQIYKDKINQLEKELKSLETLKISIEKEENLFKDLREPNALEFNTYIFKRYDLKKQLENKISDYELGSELASEELMSPKDLKDKKVGMETLKNEYDKEKIVYAKQVEDKIKTTQHEIQVNQQEQEKLIIDPNLLNTNTAQRTLKLQQYKTDTLVSLYNQIEELTLKEKTARKDLESIQIAINDCTIKAPIDGVINMLGTYNKGDLLQAGSDIAKIIPKDSNLYKIEILMPNKEIAGLKKGDTIKYKFDALPYKEYGELKGKITNISSDAIVNDALGISGYKIEATIENKVIYSYKDKPATIKVGMTCEAHVIKERKKILYYFLEKINLKD